MESRPVKPFLRKRGGITGRLMRKIHYPVSDSAKRSNHLISSTSSQSQNQSNEEAEIIDSVQNFGSNCFTKSTSASDDSNEYANTVRPYTARTADSGYPEDGCSVILSPNGEQLDFPEKSIIIDVTNPSSVNSRFSSNRVSRDFPSVIPDVSDFSVEPEVVSSKLRHQSQEKVCVRGSVNASNNSTAEFERIETRFNGTDSAESSQNSHETDGAKSVHWRQVIRQFEIEAAKKLAFPAIETVSADGKMAGVPRSHSRESKNPRSLRDAFPSIFQNDVCDSQNQGIYAKVKKTADKERETALLEKSVNESPSNALRYEKKSIRRYHSEAKNLATQLKDLIANIDIANENRNHKFDRV